MNVYFEKVKEMTREEWLNRRAEIRLQMDRLAEDRMRRLRQEKHLHLQTKKNEDIRHSLKVEEIELRYRQETSMLRDEIDALSQWPAPEKQEGGVA